MQDSDDYLNTTELENNHSYQIYSKSVYVGILQESKQGFLIPGYKTGLNNYLFTEFHWIIGEALGRSNQLNS